MSKVIYKYPLKITDDRAVVMLPVGSVPMTVQLQHDELVMWAAVDVTDPSKQPFTIDAILTGRALPPNIRTKTYLGTVQQLGGSLVRHFFGGF